MAKISQQAACDAANKIAEPLSVKAKSLRKELEKFLIELYMKDIPKEVIVVWEKYKNYLRRDKYFYVCGPGIGREYFNLSEDVPSVRIMNLELDVKNAKKFIQMKNELDDADEKYNNTKKEIANTILTLGTHKKIQEVMPNALRFLPEAKTGTGTQLVLLIQPIVDKVNCLITNEDKCVDKL
jgi:hypothetical protein